MLLLKDNDSDDDVSVEDVGKWLLVLLLLLSCVVLMVPLETFKLPLLAKVSAADDVVAAIGPHPSKLSGFFVEEQLLF